MSKIKNKKILLVLILILIITFFIRIYSLESENIWVDEGITIYHAQSSIFDNIKWSLSVGYFPLYHMIISSWVKIFGISEFSVRFLSVIFGTITVYLVYLIGKFMFSQKVGLYSAIIMALSPFNVYYSQDARVYTLFLLLSLFSIYFYLKFIESRERKDMIYYIIFTLLMLNSHSPSIFILIFQNLHYILFVREDIKKWIFVQLSVFVLLLPLILVSIRNITNLQQFLIFPKPDIITLMRTFYIFSAGPTYQINSLIFGSILSILFGVFVLLVINKRFNPKDDYWTIKKHKDNRSIVFMLMWLVVPVFLIAVNAYVYYSLYSEKYVIVSSVALYILAAFCISQFQRKFQVSSIIIIILLSLVVLNIDFKSQNKDEWKDTTNYISSHKQLEDAIVLHTPSSLYPFIYYFDRGCFKDNLIDVYSETSKVFKIRCTEQNIYGVRGVDDLPNEVTENDKVFLILWNAKYIDIEGKIFKYFTKNYNLIEEKDFGHIQIYMFKK